MPVCAPMPWPSLFCEFPMLVALLDFFLFVPHFDDTASKDRLDLGVAHATNEGGLLCSDDIGVVPVMDVLDVAIACNLLLSGNY